MPECVSVASPDAYAALARTGLRATPPRLAIWQVLRDAGDEPDAADVLRRARSLEPRTSLGTVYRFLRELELLGLATSRPAPNKGLRWKLNSTPAPNGGSPRDRAAAAAVARLAAAFGYLWMPKAHRLQPR